MFNIYNKFEEICVCSKSEQSMTAHSLNMTASHNKHDVSKDCECMMDGRGYILVNTGDRCIHIGRLVEGRRTERTKWDLELSKSALR